MTRSRLALELKGRMLSVTRVRVLEADLDAWAAQLSQMAKQMPAAVRGMSAIIDSDLDADLAALVATLRQVGMLPLAVSEGPLAEGARKLGLPVVSKDAGKPQPATTPAAKAAPEPTPPPRQPEAVASPAAALAVRKAARVVAEPVRSGQQIYAEGCDLIVLGTVSPGAEVIADGCIHIYGKLSGRAIAGARGDESARIFCRKNEAELIAIAGIYAVAEQIKESPRGEAAQAWLDQGRLKIEAHKV